MNIIIFSRKGTGTRSFHVTRWYHIAIPALVLLLMSGSLVGLGYYLGAHRDPSPLLADWQQELLLQKQQIEHARQQAEADVEALARRIGELQGHITRLDALGSKLVKMAGLDGKEFDFSREPAVGGPENDQQGAGWQRSDLLATINELAEQVARREEQLRVLDGVLLSHRLRKEVKPAGRPITRGWLSSYYGMRTDPFTGKPEFHRGIDFAGKQGSDVVAVAGGVVTWAGKRYGYGNMVEINHGNGLVTRYGHGEKILVQVGDTVKQGQVIMKMGSTGRSTGPHVHFEVLRHGRHLNPIRYIQARR